MIQKAFTIGNSTAVTIPSSANIKPGTKLRIKKISNKELVYEVLTDTKADVVKDYVAKVTNGYPIDNITQKELVAKLKYLEENPYEKE